MDALDISLTESSTVPLTSRCAVHTKKQLVVYCKVHRVPICSNCTYTEHMSCHAKYLSEMGAFNTFHDPEKLNNAPSAFQGLEEIGKELHEQVDNTIAQPASDKEKVLRSSAGVVAGVRSDLQTQLTDYLARLEADRDRILEAVTLRYKQHHDEIQAAALKKEEALKVQEVKLTSHADTLKADVEAMMGAVNAWDVDKHPLELVQTCLKMINEVGPSIASKISTAEADVALAPVEKANLHLVLPPADSLLETINGRGWVGVLEVDPTRSVLSGPALVSLAAERKYTLTLETRDQHGDLHEAQDELIKAFARSPNDDIFFPMSIVKTSSGHYDLVLPMTPDMAGQQLEIQVSYNEVPLADSPKRVLVVKSVPDSSILAGLGKNAGLGVLVRVLPGKSFKLLYRASQDGWTAKEFHSRCDKQGPTLTLAKSTDGRSVFGGYTSQSWENSKSGSFKPDKEAFLLSLVNVAGIGPVKMRVRADQDGNAIYCQKHHGPTFGTGKDLVVVPDNAQNESVCSSVLNFSYSAPGGHDGKTFLAGSPTFGLSELEVFQVVA